MNFLSNAQKHNLSVMGQGLNNMITNLQVLHIAVASHTGLCSPPIGVKPAKLQYIIYIYIYVRALKRIESN